MSSSDFLTARPIAHRGLHHAEAGIIENTASAFAAAMTANYAIECDLQLSKDGEVVVFHDDTLDRLCTKPGVVSELTLKQLKAVRLKGTSDGIMTLAELLQLVSGKVALFLEVKSAAFDGAPALLARLAAVLGTYAGPAAVMSFDPQVLDGMARCLPRQTRGIVAEMFDASSEWSSLSQVQKLQYTNLMHAWHTQPDFVAYNIEHLPSFAAMSLRAITGAPILTWTVRTPEQAEKAGRWADQIIFEKLAP